MDFCGSDKKYTDTPQWFDPLGKASNGSTASPTGGPEARSNIFNYIAGNTENWDQQGKNASNALQAAGNDPAWAALRSEAAKTGSGGYLAGSPAFDQIFANYRNAAGQKSGVTQNTLAGDYVGQNPTGTGARENRGGTVTQQTLAGKYLNSAPQLTANVDPMLAGVRARGQAEAADANANVRSSLSRAGMGFSTANQQAETANAAAATARSNETDAATRLNAQQTAEQARLNAYLAERGIQAQASGAEDAANRATNAIKAQNYMQERGYQNAAGAASDSAAQRAAELEAGTRSGQYGQERALQSNAASQLSGAYANPLNYLAQSSTPQLSTMSQIAQIVQGLAGNGQIATPNSTIVKQPGVYDYALGTLGAVSSI